MAPSGLTDIDPALGAGGGLMYEFDCRRESCGERG